MSDVVAVALITSVSTASVAIASGLFGYWIQRFRSRGETDRLKQRLQAEERRIRGDAIRAGRLRAVERLQRWVERQVVLAADVSVLLAIAPASPLNVSELIRQRLAIIQSTPPEEASINTVLSQFSDSAIMTDVRGIQQIDTELRAMLNSPEIQQAVNQQRLDRLAHLWQPVLAKQAQLDQAIAELNSRLEKYVISEDSSAAG